MPKPSKNQERMITVRLSEAEWELCKEAAAKSGMSLNKWCVITLFVAATPPAPSKDDPPWKT